MIKKEDIKEGLRFTLPNYRFKSREEEMKYNHSLVDGSSDYRPNPPCYTDIYHGESKTTLKTSYIPTFEVIGAKTMSKTGFIYTANCKCLESGKNMFINISYIESCGKMVEPEKNTDDLLKEWQERVLAEDFTSSNNVCSFLIGKYYSNPANVYHNQNSETDRFKKITDEMSDTYKAKNQDYGNSFSNLFKECGMTYAYGHMKEKLERVKSLMKDEAKVKGEGMKDSLLDLANYAILTVMELERKEGENGK